MVALCVMASAALAPAVFPCEEGLSRVKKECRSLVTFQGKRQEVPKNAFVHLQAHHLEEQMQSTHILQDCDPIMSPINPVVIDVHDSRQDDSVLFSFGIADQCTRHENILKYLLLGSNSTEKPSLSFLPSLMGFQSVPINMNHHPQFLSDDLLYKFPILESQCSMPSSLLNFVGTMSKSSLLSIDPSGRILFSGSRAEMKDLLSILSEFDLYNKSPAGSKASLLIPYFERSRFRGRNGNVSVLKFPTDTVVPLKSPGTLRTKPTTKKKQNKSPTKNRDIFQQNYFHAFESLLSVLLDKKISNTNTNTNTDTGNAILLLKKSGPKIADILTQFSIGIAGTGLAVLLSVACKRAPLCATRVLSMSFGFGLFWLCAAVNGLRDTIAEVFKMSNKIQVKDEEIACKVERSMRDVVFRAGALVALAVLRFV